VIAELPCGSRCDSVQVIAICVQETDLPQSLAKVSARWPLGTRAQLDLLRIDLVEDRFEDLKGKNLVKEEKIIRRFRYSSMNTAASEMLKGLGTGQRHGSVSSVGWRIQWEEVPPG
jgi:hypothetical protein